MKTEWIGKQIIIGDKMATQHQYISVVGDSAKVTHTYPEDDLYVVKLEKKSSSGNPPYWAIHVSDLISFEDASNRALTILLMR